MAHYRDEGIVMRTIRLGEADRIVTLITPDHGKVRAVAKGVRKTKSRIGARLEPLSQVQALVWRGRELDVISQVEVVRSFRAIREDLERLGPAQTMLEIVDFAAVERQAAPELYAVLAGALATLERAASPFLLGAFCWRLLQIEGVGPITDRCARCGSGGPLVAFDAGEGGFLCAGCRRCQAVSEHVVDLVHRVVNGGLGRVLAEASPAAAPAFEALGIYAVEHHLDRRLRSRRAGVEVARPSA
jgi:DNA repair protein RecO (recombination protein O)